MPLEDSEGSDGQDGDRGIGTQRRMRMKYGRQLLSLVRFLKVGDVTFAATSPLWLWSTLCCYSVLLLFQTPPLFASFHPCLAY